VSDPIFSTTYLKIVSRLTQFRPPIKLDKYIKSGPYVGATTLDGITFVPKDWYEILVDLRTTRTLDNEVAFAEGNSAETPRNWALDLSMAATIGKGFREIWRPKSSDRPLSLDDLPERRHRATWNVGSSARFGPASSSSHDLSSLHFAVAPDRFNVHIDQTGFVIVGPTGEIVVDPDFAQHLVNELLWKSKASKVFPDWLVDRVGIMLPSSENEFSRVGITADLRREKSYRITVTGSCSVRGGFECSVTGGVSGNF